MPSARTGPSAVDPSAVDPAALDPVAAVPRSGLGEAVVAAAWRHIAEHGAASLTLRGVARELGVTAPAIYRYFAGRDELVTHLVVDAFTSFGNAQIAARDAVPADDPVGRLAAMGCAYRTWALSHPHHYRLIFATVIPDHTSSAVATVEAGTRAMAPLVEVTQALHAAGRLRTDGIPAGMAPPFPATDPLFDGPAFAVALLIWSRMHGQVSLELAGHLPQPPGDDGALFRTEQQLTLHQFVD
jgi:AcrR family transcriptional regulator